MFTDSLLSNGFIRHDSIKLIAITIWIHIMVERVPIIKIGISCTLIWIHIEISINCIIFIIYIVRMVP
jgi:hypothetical protein